MQSPQTVKDLLFAVYSKKAKQKPAAKAAPEEAAAPAVPEKVPAPIKVEKPRSVGDVTISMRAQGIYSPDAPPAPPKPPNASQSGTGVAPAMDTSSKWDKGNK